MEPTGGYKIVKLVNGISSVHSLAHHETFHPVVGPMAEAEALYVRQLNLRERLANHVGEFVVWDVGLGAAANALAVLRATRDIPCLLRLLSFDCTIEPLHFALCHADALDYFHEYRPYAKHLVPHKRVCFTHLLQSVQWQVHVADFPTLLAQCCHANGDQQTYPVFRLPKPHAILFDPYSPAKNPAMWTRSLFANLFALLDPRCPCALPTYSRSTMLRVSLLLAGFHVGAGHATGEKEETTIAANTPALIEEPLDRKWLRRARSSTSAEPLWEPVYRQAPLSPQTWEQLQKHPQFQ